jgi:hypothetical protein
MYLYGLIDAIFDVESILRSGIESWVLLNILSFYGLSFYVQSFDVQSYVQFLDLQLLDVQSVYRHIS